MRTKATAPRLLALALLALPGCVSLGKPYERPPVTLPPAYSTGPAPEEAPPAPHIDDAWWTAFGDEQLNALVAEALAANQDLEQAAARVDEARARAGVARSEQFPEVYGLASASRARISPNTSNLPPEIDPVTPRVKVEGVVSYELDFWSRLRKASEAARADLFASEAGRRNVRLGVTSAVASAWLELVALDEALVITRETFDSRSEDVRMQGVRYEGGAISELDVAQAKAELASAEAAIPIIKRRIRQTELRLMVLLGRIGGTVERPAKALDAVRMPEPPIGLPSSLLERRPDVIETERHLWAVHARIAQARAAYFPLIALTGYAGSESRELKDLFAHGTSIWSVALDLVQPIFQANRTRREVEAVRAREHQTLAAYRKSVQTAFAEVEEALVNRSTGGAAREALARRVEALGRARSLVGLRYEAGETSYFEVLESDRDLFRARLELTEARRDELDAAVQLFKALGGGFEAKDAEVSLSAPPANEPY